MKRNLIFPVFILIFGSVLSACAGFTGVDEDPSAVKYGPQYSPQEHHMRTFDALLGHLQEKYIYAETADVEWDALRDEYSARINDELTEEQFSDLMDELAADLPVGAMSYQSRQERVEADMSDPSAYEGIGAFVGFQAEEEPHIVILGVIEGSPAESAGLKPHDSIYEIDGSPVLLEEGINAVERIRGPAGSSVMLQVHTPGTTERTIEVTRAKLISSGALETREIPDLSYGYILFPPISYDGIVEDVLESMKSFTGNKPLEGLILDLRVAGSSRGWPLEELLTLYHTCNIGEFYNSADQQQVVTITGQNLYSSQSVPLIILVGPHTSGFPEIFAASLKAGDRAIVIGGFTAGSIETSTTYYLPNGARLFVETTSFRLLNGDEIGSTGVQPNVQLEAGWDEVLPNDDPVLNLAVEILGSEK